MAPRNVPFKMVSEFEPAGDQPAAIEESVVPNAVRSAVLRGRDQCRAQRDEDEESWFCKPASLPLLACKLRTNCPMERFRAVWA